MLLIGEFQSAASSGNGFRVASIFGVHRREHLQDFWFLRMRKRGGVFKLAQGIRKVPFRSQDAAEVIAIIRIFRCKRNSLLDMSNGFIESVGVSEGNSQVVLSAGRIRIECYSFPEVN